MSGLCIVAFDNASSGALTTLFTLYNMRGKVHRLIEIGFALWFREEMFNKLSEEGLSTRKLEQKFA